MRASNLFPESDVLFCQKGFRSNASKQMDVRKGGRPKVVGYGDDVCVVQSCRALDRKIQKVSKSRSVKQAGHQTLHTKRLGFWRFLEYGGI